jgi:hypothetical protein
VDTLAKDIGSTSTRSAPRKRKLETDDIIVQRSVRHCMEEMRMETEEDKQGTKSSEAGEKSMG